jgi:hypothetical protein
MLAVSFGALAFAELHGSKTYDVGDAKGAPIVLWSFATNNLLGRLIRLGVYGGLYLAPVASRKILGVKPTIHPLGIGMLACVYTRLAEVMPEAAWKERAKSLLHWLTENTIPAPRGETWGSPYPWFSYGGVMPVTIGGAHGNIWMANAFYSYYQLTRDNWALEHAVRTCEYLAYCLNPTKHSSGSLSLSYTVLDNSQCINVNADIANILLQLGRHIGHEDFITIGIGTLRFTLETQNADGSWNYDIPISGRPWAPNIDGFHTGMVLSALTGLMPVVQTIDPHLALQCHSELSKGITFYMNNLFTPDGHPLYAIKKRYPVDPYSCGQAMITLLDVCEAGYVDRDVRNRAEDLLHRVADQTIRLMWDADGSFLTARYRFRKIRLKSLRWAQALLCLAFVRYTQFLLSRLNGHSTPDDVTTGG